MSYNRIATLARLRTALINGITVPDRSLAELARRLTVDPKFRTALYTIADGRPLPAARGADVEANDAQREIFTAKEAFAPRDPTRYHHPLPGALVVITHWPMHTDVYRIEADVID